MALQFPSVVMTEYTFLAHPPSLKMRSKHPLYVEHVPPQTSRRRSSTFSGIVAWASNVQPGSPGSLSPRSLHHRPSLGKSCFPSIASIRGASTSFSQPTLTPNAVHVTTPSVCDFKIDLTSVGYASVFLHLPDTPVSATLSFSLKPSSSNTGKGLSGAPIRSLSCKSRGLTRLCSLSVLRSRGRSKSITPTSPNRMKVEGTTTSIVKRKKSKYPMRPPPLSNELALMQFVDGGSMDNNIKRIMEAQAKVTGAVGHADVYRDGVDGVWLDQEEELEYAHLLVDGDSRPGHAQWVTFGTETVPPSRACLPEDERRESLSTQDSDLAPNRIVQPVDLLGGDDLAFFGDTLVAPVTRTQSTSLLAIPSRPSHAARHLQKPNLVDVGFLHHSFPNISGSLYPPRADVKHRKKERRRPAPLKLSPPSPSFNQPANSPTNTEKARQDFIESRFEPAPISAPATSLAPVVGSSGITQPDSRTRLVGSSRGIDIPRRTQTTNDGSRSLGMKSKKSLLNLKGLFRSRKK